MKLKALLLVLTFCVLPFKTPAPIFMKIEGVDGESVDATYPASLEIESFSWGMSNTTTTVGGGGGTGKVSMQDFHFTRRIDKASPKLMLNCATGRYIPKIDLYLRRTAGDKPVEYYKVTLEDVLVSSYQTSGSGSDDRPTESFSLNFTKVTVEYKAQKADGSLDTPVVFTYNKATGI